MGMYKVMVFGWVVLCTGSVFAQHDHSHGATAADPPRRWPSATRPPPSAAPHTWNFQSLFLCVMVSGLEALGRGVGRPS